MLEYSRKAVEIAQSKSRTDLDLDPLLLPALTYYVGVVGEAASKITLTIRQQFPHVPWSKIIEMRNILFHDYFQVQPDILWTTIQDALPAFISDLEQLLVYWPTDNT
jgi:uncharacterized protein with HEPN domain